MWPYWILFLIPALAAVSDQRLSQPISNWSMMSISRTSWVGVGIILTAIVGFRYEVGGDWDTYEHNLNSFSGATLTDVLELGDPGYQLFSWISLWMGWGIVGVNVLSATIFASGLAYFCRTTPLPWLALATAIPYMVVVLAMGYTRQSIALGFVMFGLVAVQRRQLTKFLTLVVLGATFHKTAVLLLPIAAIAATKNRFWVGIWAGIVTISAYGLLLEESAQKLIINYVDAEYQSEGALVRLAMNAVPAGLFFRWRYNIFPDREDRMLWTCFSVISLILFAAFFVSPSSTALDRIALYMLPLQLAIFSRLPIVFGGIRGTSKQWAIVVLICYTAVLLVWLNFAQHSKYWIPYKFYPLHGIF